ncbi:MAG: DUF1549 domain-containing protein [Planctomycetaceae bacterium]
MNRVLFSFESMMMMGGPMQGLGSFSQRAVPLFVAILLSMAPLVSSASAEDRPVDFNTEIIPVLTKAGCNAGACHGAAIGRGGFKLSLYGGNPAADYVAIVRQLEGRRVNLAHPDRSLLLVKSTEYVSHEGGDRFAMDSESARRIRRWIAEGAAPGGKRRLTQFVVSPESRIVNSVGKSAALKAIATFDDGRTEDVTRFTVFTPEDPSAVKLASKGGALQATVRRRGEHVVIARFLDRVVPLRLIVPLSTVRVDHSRSPRKNFVDEFLLKKLETLRLPAAPPAGDSAFLRRATLDLTGRLPTPEEAGRFAADKRADKHKRLIDRLLKSDAFVDYQTFQYAKLLRIRSQPQDATGARTYHRWLRKQIRAGTSLKRVAATLITATGDSHTFGPANFYRTLKGPRNQAEFVSELFMGVRLRCANCHNHPLDHWTQDDYHGFSAIFAKVKTGRVITIGTRGEVTHPVTGEAAVPRIPGERFLDAEQTDGRKAFADWLTAGNNPYFAKAIVNRLWKSLMGRGLVEPADDLRATNPATHPELLDRLAKDFETHGYKIRRTLRLIAGSAAYARGQVPGVSKTSGTSGLLAADDRYYSRRIARRLEPEVLVDAVCDVTGVPEKFGGQSLGTRAVNLFDGKTRSQTLDILGRCDRSASCESGGSTGGGLTAKLHWINGEFLNRKVGDKRGRLGRAIAAGKSNAQIVEAFYLRALTRKPTAKQAAYWNAQLAAAKTPAERKAVLEDFVWSLLSCREFQFR